MVYSSYFSDVLLVVQAVDNCPGANEEHCFKEGVSTDVEEG